jgi:hypothetical protein
MPGFTALQNLDTNTDLCRTADEMHFAVSYVIIVRILTVLCNLLLSPFLYPKNSINIVFHVIKAFVHAA